MKTKTFKKNRFALILSILFCCNIIIPQAQAAIINAGSCSQADVQAAINSAGDGGTVNVPTGNCNWSGTININRQRLTIQGAGVGQTIITSSGQLFSTAGESANGLRVTAIEFRNCVQCFYFDGSGSPKEATKNFRIDQCKFKNVNIAFETDGRATGVLDHNTFEDSYGARIYGSNDAGASFPFTLGTSDSVYFEDNTITVSASASPAHFIASNSGSRYVLRHNNFNYVPSLWGIIDAHGYCEVAGRGSFTWEVYDNTFTIPSGLEKVMQFRGGQGVVFNNTINTGTWPIVLTDYMTCSPPCVSTCSGYPCQDQINHAYFWNNKKGGTPFDPTDDCDQVIQLNRDYFTTAMPGYTPYTYPHPLVGGADSPPSPPKNIRTR
jgi:hypothetical protein